MCQVFPHHSYLVEDLRISLVHGDGRTWCKKRTSLVLCEFLVGRTLTYLMCTLEPSKVPSHTLREADRGPMFRREPESAQDFGSNPLMLHILPRSCRDSWNARLVWSETPTRTYACIEHRAGSNLKTHAIQILDEPGQILVFQAWYILIVIPTEEVDELLVRPGQGSVEVVGLSQGTVRDHEDVWLGQRLADALADP